MSQRDILGKLGRKLGEGHMGISATYCGSTIISKLKVKNVEYTTIFLLSLILIDDKWYLGTVLSFSDNKLKL